MQSTQRGHDLICKSIKFSCYVYNCCSLVDSYLSLSPVLSLDADQKEQLIEVIEKLLKDKSTVSTDGALSAEHFPHQTTTGGRPSQAILLPALHPTAHSAMPWFVNTHLNPHIFRCSLLSVHLEGIFALMLVSA